MTIVKLDPEHGVGQGLDYRPLDLDGILLRQAPGLPFEQAKYAGTLPAQTRVYGLSRTNVYSWLSAGGPLVKPPRPRGSL